MRKIITVALIVFALAFTFGISSDTPQAAGSKCWYSCDCNGTALYCCRTQGKVVCKVLIFSPIECTQQADC